MNTNTQFSLGWPEIKSVLEEGGWHNGYGLAKRFKVSYGTLKFLLKIYEDQGFLESKREGGKVYYRYTLKKIEGLDSSTQDD